MPVTLNDIAEKADLSVSTVSRILNDKADQYSISGKSKRLVLKIANELDYKPNALARALRLKKTLSLGLIVPDISNPFFAYVTRSIQRTAHQLGYSVIVCDTDENQELEIEHINLLRSKGIDGLIMMPAGQSCDHLKVLDQEGLPLVLLDRYFEELDTHCVLVDNYNGALNATEHLIEHGHTRIAVNQGLPFSSTNKDRIKGYEAALNRHEISIERSLIVGEDFREESGYRAAKCILTMEEPPSAIFALSDLITLGTYKAIYEADLKIPDDISLVSFDDVDFSPYLASPLTAVAQPRQAMGEAAVRILVDLMEDDTESDGKIKHNVLQPNLIVRGSVASPPE